MMKIRLQLFAAARDLAGAGSLEVLLPEGATVADLRQVLAQQTPALAEVLRYSRFAVNADYALDTTLIPPGAEVACIPPVSGG